MRVLGPPKVQPDMNDVTKHVINVFWDVKPTELPLRPEAVASPSNRRKAVVTFRLRTASLPAFLP